MYKRLVKKLAAVVALAAAFSFAGDDPFASWVEDINTKGFGTFSGRIQSLAMFREIDNTSVHTWTLGFMPRYETPNFGGLSAAVTYVEVVDLGSDDPGSATANDRLSLMIEAYVKFDLRAIDLEKTYVQVGRIIPDFLFVPTGDWRQKPQAIEGAMFRTEDIDDLKLSVVWAHKFSAYQGTDNDWVNYEFQDISEVFYGANAPYTTGGMMIFDAVYTGIDGVTINVGDIWLFDIINMPYADVSIDLGEKLTWRGTWAHQYGVGDYNDSEYENPDLQSTFLETSLKIKPCSNFDIRPGFCTVLGRNDGGNEDHNFYDLFMADVFPGWPQIGSPWGLNAGTRMFFVDSNITVSEKMWVYLLYAYTDADNTSTNGDTADGHELNVQCGYDFTSNFSIRGDFAYSVYDVETGSGNDFQGHEFRLWATYKF